MYFLALSHMPPEFESKSAKTNPMKIEQRIGRIDRIGQKADKIKIVNFVIQGTIDEAIFERVGKRIVAIKST